MMKKKIIVWFFIANVCSFVLGSVFTVWTVLETQLKHNAFISLSTYRLLAENEQEKGKKLQAMCFIGKIKTIEEIDRCPLAIFFINDWFYPKNKYESMLKDRLSIEEYWLKSCQSIIDIGVGGDRVNRQENLTP